MSYFRYIDNGEGPTKLFVGGIHGNEGKTSLNFLNKLKIGDFSNGQIYIYNFDKTKYISTLNEEYFKSNIGLKLLKIIKNLKPDFYTELHCYNIINFKKLTSLNRLKLNGIPPLIDLGDYVLISSVSPLIRKKYFSRDTICKNLEFPCFDKLNNDIINKYHFNEKSSIKKYNDFLKLICLSTSRADFESKVLAKYPNEAKLANSYAEKIFGKGFPPY